MTRDELYSRQKWTLNQKIDHSLGVIDQFLARTDGKAYLAYSGGKDSTVLMYLCEIIKRDILCVFVNTGCEYKSIVHFVHEMKDAGHNIEFIRQNHTPIADIYMKGAKRTGCAACGFGCQFKHDTRLQLLHDIYPKYYDMVMKFENNGVTYREALRKMLAVNGLALPDEDMKLPLEFVSE